jgi:hypothetical protein
MKSEELIYQVAMAVFVVGGFTLVVWVVKFEFARLNGSINDIIKNHNACRDSLPGRFVSVDYFKEWKDEFKAVAKQLEPLTLDIKLIMKQIRAKERKSKADGRP